MEEPRTAAFRQQLESLYSISIEISRLHEMPKVLDRALSFCLELTLSEFGFIGLLNGNEQMDVAAIKGFEPSDPSFYENFRLIPVRPSVFGVVITDRRSKISNDVLHDPDRVGQPRGHPPVRTFLGVPLQVGERVIGMIGVANKPSGYTTDEERERIASELHDRIEQAIFMLGLKVNAILEREPVAEPIASDLGEVRQLAVHTSEAVREAIFALSLPRPAASGLLFEMRRLVRELGQSEDLEADLVVSGKPLRLGGQAEQTLYILAREALANVVRHARARRVLVSLRYSDHHVDLVIQDDGAGASDQILQHYQESGTHFGMKRSRRQVEDLGGTFDVRNGEESGLAIRVRIPVAVA